MGKIVNTFANIHYETASKKNGKDIGVTAFLVERVRKGRPKLMIDCYHYGLTALNCNLVKIPEIHNNSYICKMYTSRTKLSSPVATCY